MLKPKDFCIECLKCGCTEKPHTRWITPGQVTISLLMLDGPSTAELSRRSGKTVGTLKVYLQHIYQVMGFTKRLHLTLWAIANEKALRAAMPTETK